ncbi:autotransporter assembly complex protein TamA [Sphingomonas sanguinis]|jgi:translocation and assembly module TamA|uniref:Outer membrane protein assembly factor n=2 Tax=Sphingomonas sanguinis TaxID=33051 RepID=A0A7Y7QT79_9SPHN|nr:autotransporter assembly complex family protein [Sphingomonas sanguinis]MBZ6380980.1 BamA/TamA family outer membrane protein [Sphingomonas sanguinis]NVP30281.1 outer membrane protein assembly factor [Sphingomonas sanguinis]
MMVRVGRPCRSAAILMIAMGVGGTGWSGRALAQTATPTAPTNQTVPTGAPPEVDDPTMLDPSAPLAPLPEIGVAWPDLATAPGDPAGVMAATVDAAAERRYHWKVEGIDGAGALVRQRFEQLSSLDNNDGEPANAAQLDRRAREDAALLTNLLRGAGYYDAQVATRIEPGDQPTVVLEATPGNLYRFAGVTLAGVQAAGDKAAPLEKAFGIRPGDPVDADTIVAGEAKLKAAVGEEGFPFAKIGDPQIVVDRAARTATLDLSVDPGSSRRYGRIVMANDTLFDARHVQDIARFQPGQPYDSAGLDDLRRALVQTGLVSSVDVKPVPGDTPDTVNIAVALEPAPPHTIAGELGYGTGEGASATINWTDRNLFPPEGALTLRSVLGTREQLGAVVFRRNNFQGRDRVLTAQFSAAHILRDAYEAKTLSLSGGLERQTNIFFQKTWTWSLGAELLTSDERDVIESTGEPRRRTFFIGALPTSLNYDGSDDLLNPTRGFRLGGRLSPEVSLQGSVFGYTRTQIDASLYHPFGERVVLAARTRLGTILGAPRDQIAPSRRFYAGGGASVRGYGFQAIGPRDANNDPIGGRSLAEFSIEARVRTFGNFGIVPFLDAGNISTTPLPRLTGLRFGTGLGVRYYSNFGPIRLDVGTPLNPQKGDSRVAVYVSLGQAF